MSQLQEWQQQLAFQNVILQQPPPPPQPPQPQVVVEDPEEDDEEILEGAWESRPPSPEI